MKRPYPEEYQDPVYYELEDLPEDNDIEDEPERIDLVKIFRMFLKHWKALMVLMAVCGILMGILRPGTSNTVIGAKATLYIPPTIYRTVNGQRRMSSNNLSQIENALGLITSKVYRDEIAAELGTDSISNYGSYSVTRQKDTQLITIDVTSSSSDRAEKLCTAVMNVLQNSVGKTVSISNMMVVDPVRGYSNITVTSTLTSVFRGMLIGIAVYCCYIAFKYFTDRTLHSKEEAEEYLEIPILCVLPDLVESSIKKTSRYHSGKRSSSHPKKNQRKHSIIQDQNEIDDDAEGMDLNPGQPA